MKKQLKGENREEIKIVYLGKEILCSVIVFYSVILLGTKYVF